MTTLKDLRTLNPLHPGAITGGGEVFPATQPATLSDLREVLEGLGATKEWRCEDTKTVWAIERECERVWSDAGDHSLCGWVLVIPVDALEETPMRRNASTEQEGPQ